MSLKGYKLHLFVYLVILISIVGIYSLTVFWPKYEERFFELGLLGKYKTAEDYFLGAGSTVLVDSDVSWFIYVKNVMHSEQDITIRAKLLNSTMQTSNDTRHEPSPFSPFFELPLSISDNETLFIPFTWKIIEADVSGETIHVRRLTVNDQPLEVTVSSISDTRFRIVFELWVYNHTSQQYEFGWESGREHRSVSVYMWFDLPYLV